MVVATDQGQKEKWGGSNAAEELGILVFQDKKKKCSGDWLQNNVNALIPTELCAF